MKKFLFILLAFTNSICVCAQKKLFQKALEKGREKKEFYHLRNDDDKFVRIEDLEKYAKEKEYILYSPKLKSVSRFGYDQESVAEVWFLPQIEHPYYVSEFVFSDFLGKEFSLTPSSNKGSAYLYVGPTTTNQLLNHYDDVIWSGNVNNGKIEGPGAGILIKGKKYFFFNSEFKDGFPIKLYHVYIYNLTDSVSYAKGQVTSYDANFYTLSDGLAAYQLPDNPIGFVDTNGHIAIAPRFDELISDFSNDQAIVTEKGKEIVINNYGIFVDYSDKQKSLDSLYSQAMMYYKGAGVDKDLSKAVILLNEVASQGHMEAQNSLGDCYYNGEGVSQDYAKAVEWYRKAAEQGLADAQNHLGICYDSGDGVTKDYAKAAELYAKAAEQGHMWGQYNLAVNYFYGEGVTKDYAKAAEWFRKSAVQGNANAQNWLGGLYYDGEGVSQSYAQAVEWYRKAAEQGDASAQNSLGVCYDSGKGVTQDYAKALEWFKKAAEQGYEWSLYNIGNCYINGKGVAKNESEALKWWQKAADKGLKEAREAISNYHNQKEADRQRLQEQRESAALRQSFNRRLGYNTVGTSIGRLVSVGRSISAVIDYINTYYVGDNDWFINLSADYGDVKSYKLFVVTTRDWNGTKRGRHRATIWTNNGRITSVIW